MFLWKTCSIDCSPKALRCQREGSDYAYTRSAVSAEHRGACSMTWGSVSADRSFIASGFHPAFPQNSRPIWSRKSRFCGNRLFALSRPVGQLSWEPVDQLHARSTRLFSPEQVAQLHRGRSSSSLESRKVSFTEVGRPVLFGMGSPALQGSVISSIGFGCTASPVWVDSFFRETVCQHHRSQ
jgi:hypothetical protein